jgi:type II pantothenate kinase
MRVSMTTRAAPLAPRARVSAMSRPARVVAARAVSASAAGAADAATTSEAIRERAKRGALAGARPFPLLRDPASYSHVSPGVCDACANAAEARRAWVALLAGQLPSHRANAARTKAHLGLLGSEAEAFDASYLAWEEDYEAYLNAVSSGEDADVARDAGATLLDMVDEKERLLRIRGLDDLFAGMKAQENAVAAALFPALAREMDAVWNEKTTLNSKPSSDAENDADEKRVDVLKAVLECCLAGNLFDAGAAAAVQGVADAAAAADDETCGSNLDAARLAETFAEARRRVARDKNFVDDNADSDTGWRFDSFDAVSARIKNKKKPWRRVVIFCDNAGADVMGMCLLARTLVQLSGDGQCKVALAANEWAALNDVTARETRLFLESVVRCAGGDDDGDSTLGDDEAFFGDGTLLRQMERGLVTCVSSGQISTLLDLNRCGSELNDWVEEELHDVPAGDDWLLVFDGMGRSLESNWDVASFVKPGVNTLNLAMVKSQINAERLGAEVYDCVVKLGEGGV